MKQEEKKQSVEFLSRLIQKIENDEIKNFNFSQDFPVTPKYNLLGEVIEFSRKGHSITTNITIVDKPRTK